MNVLADLALPPALAAAVDRRYLRALTAAEQAEVRALAGELGVHLVAYVPGAGDHPGVHLCRSIEPAALPPAAVARVDALAARLGGAVLVAYERPVRLRGPR